MPRKSPVSLTAAQKEEILRRGYRFGDNLVTIAAKYNVTRNVIGDLFRKNKSIQKVDQE
jgi:hypothetical protein